MVDTEANSTPSPSLSEMVPRKVAWAESVTLQPQNNNIIMYRYSDFNININMLNDYVCSTLRPEKGSEV